MDGEIPRRGRMRKSARVTFFSLGFWTLLIRDALVDDAAIVWNHFRLVFGVVLLLTGLLTFDSGRYCDGLLESQADCTRPSTYYYFDATSIILMVIGALLVVVWRLRDREG